MGKNLKKKAVIKMLNKYQTVRLKTGERAVIVEILGGGKAFVVDIMKAEDEWQHEQVRLEEIASVFEEVERPLATA
ncbi:MAG: hypothetical protein FWG87_04480 [Defluviitaleaceae bacterium]|nr:hypothetical protein [Defluviitaleaceae bacterium]